MRPWAPEAGEPGREPRNDPVAAEREHEDQQESGYRGIEALERQLQQPCERIGDEPDQAEGGHADRRPERCRRAAEQHCDEQLEREERVVRGRVGDTGELHREPAGEPGQRRREREGAEPLPRERHAERGRQRRMLAQRGELEPEGPASRRRDPEQREHEQDERRLVVNRRGRRQPEQRPHRDDQPLRAAGDGWEGEQEQPDQPREQPGADREEGRPEPHDAAGDDARGEGSQRAAERGRLEWPARARHQQRRGERPDRDESAGAERRQSRRPDRQDQPGCRHRQVDGARQRVHPQARQPEEGDEQPERGRPRSDPGARAPRAARLAGCASQLRAGAPERCRGHSRSSSASRDGQIEISSSTKSSGNTSR